MKILLFFILFTGVVFADTNILIIASGRSFSEGRLANHQDPLNPQKIADELQKILSMDRRLGKVKVSVDDYYTKKHIDTNIGGNGQVWRLEYHRYSLAQYYFWPEGRKARLKNLQGKLKVKWDVIILIDDPYLTANMPGIHAEGVKLLTQEIRKGDAKPFIFSQWPRAGTNKKAAELHEISYRVSRGLGIRFIPAAYVWESLKNKVEADKYFIAANSIYRTLFYKNTTGYEYKNLALDRQIKSALKESFSKKKKYGPIYTSETPFTMKKVTRRQIWGNHSGTSTENGLTKQLYSVFAQGSVLFKRGKNPTTKKTDFNYGRANSNFEANKRYRVDPKNYDRSYGFVMQDNGRSAYNTMLYGIDKRTFLRGNNIDDGTDMGIASDMIELKEVEKDIRTIPGRLINAKIMDYDPKLTPVNAKGDTWHQRGHLLLAQASFVYTLLNGRYALDVNKTSEGQNSMMMKIGYDTAWTMSTLQARSPGFTVRPSYINLLSLKTGQQESMSICFANKPKSTVKVQVSVNGAKAVDLTFTEANYKTAQTFKFKNAGKAQSVTFKTLSRDPVYHNLTDRWDYGSGK